MTVTEATLNAHAFWLCLLTGIVIILIIALLFLVHRVEQLELAAKNRENP